MSAKSAKPVKAVKSVIDVTFQLSVRSGRPVSDTAVRSALANHITDALAAAVAGHVNGSSPKNAGLIEECHVSRLRAVRADRPAAAAKPAAPAAG